jgi:hypothetical protein
MPVSKCISICLYSTLLDLVHFPHRRQLFHSSAKYFRWPPLFSHQYTHRLKQYYIKKFRSQNKMYVPYHWYAKTYFANEWWCRNIESRPISEETNKQSHNRPTHSTTISLVYWYSYISIFARYFHPSIHLYQNISHTEVFLNVVI